jgi:methylmalonyl-CoA mutase cobalamin-binding subunit
MVIAGLPTDTHTWNLAYLELHFRERGFSVRNVGSCASAAEIAHAVRAAAADVVVLSSVNGHGHLEGGPLAAELRRRLDFGNVPLVIGGKLTIDAELGETARRELLAAGFDAVFFGENALADFDRFLIERAIGEQRHVA